MNVDFTAIAIQLTVALAAGGVIGIERSYHGRPAGFRTHALVCLASSLLMLVTLYQQAWLLPGVPLDSVRTDPTRMAQGIMTGIGFLGAGVIFKDNLSVRGLTTAASIWITAAIGILIGIGFYAPAALATIFTLITLSLFRWVEPKLPSHFYANYFVRFARKNVMPEAVLRAFLQKHGFSVAKMSHRLSDDGLVFEYRMVIKTRKASNTSELAVAMRETESVRAFRIIPASD